MLSRPSDTGPHPLRRHFHKPQPGHEVLGHAQARHEHRPGDRSAWQSTKIGAGPIPIETDEGWLLIYHVSSPPATALSTAWAPPCWTGTSRGMCSAAARTISTRPMSSTSAWATCRTSPSPLRRSRRRGHRPHRHLLRLRRHRYGPRLNNGGRPACLHKGKQSLRRTRCTS